MKIRILYVLFRLALSPESFKYIEKLRVLARKQGLFRLALDHTAKFPENQRALREHWLFDDSVLGMARFEKLPVGTLGRAYADFLKVNNLSALYYSPVLVKDDEDYYILRTLQTHDLWHVVLGWSTSYEDEIRIQVFMYAQVRAPLAGFLVGGYIFRLIFSKPTHLNEGLQAITDGWQTGNQTSQFFGVHWEDLWEKPLSEVRAMLGVSRASGPTINHISR